MPIGSSVRPPACCEPPDAEQAEIYYRQALTLAEELGMRPLQAHCHRGLGTLYATTVSMSRPVPNYLPPSSSIAPWICSSGSQAEATLAQVR